MEKVKEMAKPHTFPVFKVAKSSLEFIRFEAEIDNYGSMNAVLTKLDMKTIKLSGFAELLKVCYTGLEKAIRQDLKYVLRKLVCFLP